MGERLDHSLKDIEILRFEQRRQADGQLARETWQFSQPQAGATNRLVGRLAVGWVAQDKQWFGRRQGVGKWRDAFARGRPSRWDIDYGLEYTFGPPATEAQLAHVESQLGVRLPIAVRELLGEFNGVWTTSEDGRRLGGKPDILFLDTECMTVRVPRYLRYWGAPPITPRGADLRKVAFVAQVNGLADLYGVCLEPVAQFPTGAVVKLDHETGELEGVCSSVQEFVEYGLK